MLDWIIEQWMKYDTFIIDTETSSLYPWRDGEILAGISIKPLGAPSLYFPFYHGEDAQPGHHGTTDRYNLSWNIFETIWNFLRNKKKKFVFHNAKFDMAVLYNEGIDFTKEDVYDTVVLMRLVSENESSYELKDLAFKYINGDARKEQNKIRKYLRDHELDNYAQIPSDVITAYAKKDVDYTEWLYIYAMEKIETRGLQELLALEQRVTKQLFEVERKGFLVDREFVEKRLAKLVPEKDKAEQVCYDQVKSFIKKRWKTRKSLTEDEVTRLEIAIELLKEQDGTFKIHSAHDVRKMFKAMGINSGVLTATGGESWAKDALKTVAKEHEDSIARLLAQKISVVRALNKIIVDYYGKFLLMMDDNNVIHASLHQAGTRTGRLSCREPNLQNIPKEGTFDLLGEEDEENKGLTEVRDAFIPRPNHFLLMADWSQIELRILAEYADEPLWKKAFEYGIDIHKVAARSAFGPEPDNEKDAYQWRQNGKNLNFAVVYGVGNAKLGKAMGVTSSAAKKFKKDYFKIYTKIKEFSDLAQSTCEGRTMRVCKIHTSPTCLDCSEWTHKGWIKNRWGRRRYLEPDKSYVAVNFIIQSNNAELLKDTFDRTQNSLDKKTASVVDLVHDEQISEINYMGFENAISNIVGEMQITDKFEIPIKVGLQWSPTRWGQAKSLDCSKCAGNGKIYPFDEKQMAELLFQHEWDKIEQAGIKTCSSCEGKGYDTSAIQAVWEELQGETQTIKF